MSGSDAAARSVRFRRRRRSSALGFGLFFNLRPALPLPLADLVFVPLQRTPHRTLATPAQLPQNAPGVPGVVANPAFLLDQMGHARRRPQAAPIAQCLRSAFQALLDPPQVFWLQPGRTASMRRLLQPLAPLLPQRLGPLADRLAVRPHPPRHFRMAQPLLQQSGRLQPSPLQSLKIAPHAIEAEPGITLRNLLEKTCGVAEPDEIYMLIASGAIHVDLNVAPIAEPERVRVFLTAQMAAACEVVCRETCVGSDIHRNDGRPRELPGVRSEAFLILAAASEQDLAIANQRFDIVREHLAGSSSSCSTPARTLRLWTAQYRSARELYGSGYLGLLPEIGKRGNRTSRLSEVSRDLLRQFVENDYETLRQKSLLASWAALKRKCDECGVTAPSHVTFNAAVRSRPAFEQTLKRQGRRAAYVHSAFYYELKLTTPRHGDRPFEIGHIDHTQLDVEVVCSQTGRPLGRPWMSILTDAFSRRCLALYLTFDEPSYRSCMMILRDCVSRHNRLPEIIVVDGGPEFKSTYFETLLAEYECTQKTRPPAKARFGSVCERLFGTTNTQFLHNLRGNTQIRRNIRQVTKSNNPEGQAVWSLSALHRYLSSFLFEIYDTIEHPALGQTPRDAYIAGLRTTGSRTNRMITFDQAFLMATLPTTQRGTAKVMPGRGVKVKGVHYWAEAFRDPSVESRDVAIRYDPFDMGTAYAFVNRLWTECHSEYYAVLHGRSQKEIMFASKEVRRRSQLHSRGRFTLTARKLAEFLTSAESEEKHLMQQLRDSESKGIRQNDLFLVPDSVCSENLPGDRQTETAIPIANACEFAATALYGDF